MPSYVYLIPFDCNKITLLLEFLFCFCFFYLLYFPISVSPNQLIFTMPEEKRCLYSLQRVKANHHLLEIPDQRELTILKSAINSSLTIESNICDSHRLLVKKKIISEKKERVHLHQEEPLVTTDTSDSGPSNPKKQNSQWRRFSPISLNLSVMTVLLILKKFNFQLKDVRFPNQNTLSAMTLITVSELNHELYYRCMWKLVFLSPQN